MPGLKRNGPEAEVLFLLFLDAVFASTPTMRNVLAPFWKHQLAFVWGGADGGGRGEGGGAGIKLRCHHLPFTCHSPAIHLPFTCHFFWPRASNFFYFRCCAIALLVDQMNSRATLGIRRGTNQKGEQSQPTLPPMQKS